MSKSKLQHDEPKTGKGVSIKSVFKDFGVEMEGRDPVGRQPIPDPQIFQGGERRFEIRALKDIVVFPPEIKKEAKMSDSSDTVRFDAIVERFRKSRFEVGEFSESVSEIINMLNGSKIESVDIQSNVQNGQDN